MNLKKTAISAAVAAALTGAIAAPAQADVIDMDFIGLFTILDSNGSIITNTSKPYYYDATWNYGKRTQITGTLTFDTATGAGSGTMVPFDFFSKGAATASNIQFQSIGGGLMLGSFGFNWNSSDISTQIVLDASGLFGALGGGIPPVGAILDQTACGGLPCATPASDGGKAGTIGAVPIATSSFNTAGQNGLGTTLAQLTLGTDDGIGGSPMDNGPFSGANANFDILSVEITAVTPAIPVPAAVWLFGSGLLGLVGVARRRKA